MGLPPNFCFVWEDKVAGSGHPGQGETLGSALGSLRGKGIHSILSLSESALDLGVVRNFEFDYLHLPIEDFAAPTQDQIDQAVGFLGDQVDLGNGALIHCQAGLGRTGTILACFLVHQGMEPAGAIEAVRQLRPGSLEVYSQEHAVLQYWKRRRQASQNEGEE